MPTATSGRPTVNPWVRAATSVLIRAALRVFFRRVERFHVERAPHTGPALFVSNHPGSLTDAFIIGSSVRRVVHFVATARLFRSKPIAALLARCAVVPISRKQDGPAVHSVAETFGRCFEVLDHGGAIGIFPEGVSYNDEQMRPVKTGAARMALEAEDRNDGHLGLAIVPVGLTYSAKGRYRSNVLANFGEPFRAAAWLEAYRVDRHAAVRALSAEIEHRIRSLILDLPSLEHQRIVTSVKRLYLDRFRGGNLLVTETMPPAAEELVLSQALGQALAYVEERYPDRLADFLAELARYEQRLGMIGLPDRAIETLDESGAPQRPGVLRTVGLALGAPVALFGWVHRIAPAWFTEWAVEKYSPQENLRAQVAHGSMIAGLLGFGTLYLVAAATMWYLAGPALATAYVLSLPIASMFAHWYFRAVRRFARDFKAARLLLRSPVTRRNLARMRARLIGDIDGFRDLYRREVFDVAHGAEVVQS